MLHDIAITGPQRDRRRRLGRREDCLGVGCCCSVVVAAAAPVLDVAARFDFAAAAAAAGRALGRCATGEDQRRAREEALGGEEVRFVNLLIRFYAFSVN